MAKLSLSPELITKFNIPVPRYTSYPTAPEWTSEFGDKQYREILAKSDDSPLSLYVHIPFCESLCWYCGCNVVIKKDRKEGDLYIDALIREMDLVTSYLGSKRKALQLHWGGGTPTFLTSPQIQRLFEAITNRFELDPQAEIAIEIDPRTIDAEKLSMLRQLGFNRISMGVQDFNPEVQEAVHRIQPFGLTQKYVEQCRRLKFESVNLDLIYGLPYQNLNNFEDTIQKTIELHPDRIALFLTLTCQACGPI